MVVKFCMVGRVRDKIRLVKYLHKDFRAIPLAISLGLTSIAAPTLAETIRIGGSGAGLGTMTQLAAAFHKEHPLHQVTVLPSLGTSGGLKALQAKAIDIAVSARDINIEEKNVGMSAYRYGTTAFIIVSNSKVPAEPLTIESLANLYSGKQSHWSNGQPVRLILRPKGDSDTKQLSELDPEIKAAVVAAHAKTGMIVAITDTGAADHIEKIPGSLGTSTLALVLSENRNFNIFSLNGVKPSIETLTNGRYPYAKDLFVITTATQSEGTKLFLQFLRSSKGTEILKSTGHKVHETP